MKFANYFDKKSWKKDEGTINTMESLTDDSYLEMTDVNAMLMTGRAVPRVPPADKYNMNNYEIDSMSLDDWVNIKATMERKFLHLSPEAKIMFGSPQAFFKYATNPENYEIKGGELIEKQDSESSVAVPQIPGEKGQSEKQE